jgi:hypothetical protein
MLRIDVNPTRIERVVIEVRSAMERDFDIATLVALQPHLQRIDRDLRRMVKGGPRERETK